MKIVRGNSIEYTPASHEDPNDPGCLKKVLATKADLISGQVQMANWSKLSAGKSFQPHYHKDMQEFFVMMEGQARMVVNGEEYELNAGDALLVDPMEVHSMTNETDVDITYFVLGISTGKGGKTIVVE